MVIDVDPARGSALNEQELWREMVRWSGGRIVEDHGILLVSGPSAYLRVAMRTDPRVDGSAVVARAIEFFEGEPAGFTSRPCRTARRRGLGDSLTRLAAYSGFEMGADAAWLGASEMGASLYRRIGFEALGSTTLVELEAPTFGGV